MLAPARRFTVAVAAASTIAASTVAALSVAASAALAAPVSAAPARATPAHALAFPSQEWWLATLRIADAWKYSKGAGMTVAVVDSGVQASLPVLSGQVLPGKDFTGVGDDARTDYLQKGAVSSLPQGHGTGMATLIAANGASGGYVGIAPAAKILPVRVTPPHGDTDPNAVDPGIKWAVDHGAKIINASFSSETQSCAVDDQAAVDYVNQHGAILIAATGNDSLAPVGSPAGCEGAIGVGAVDKSFVPYDDESTGAALTFVAPGVDTVFPGLNGVLLPPGSGTSDSTAIMSGVLALVWSKFPTETPRQIITRLLYSLNNGIGEAKYGTRINDEIGYGMPLPFSALTANPPSGAKNPIYDAIDARLNTAPSSGVTTSSASSTTAGAKAGGSNTSGQTVARIVIGGGLLLVIVVVVALLLTRRRKGPPPGPPGYAGGYPPPGYGPPPP